MTTSSMRASFLSFTGRAKILHTTWLAFFVTFLVWFNHAPLLGLIQESMGLSDQQIKTLLILNVALNYPCTYYHRHVGRYLWGRRESIPLC